MPAEEVVKTKAEAPATEPLLVEDSGVALRSVARTYRSRRGDVVALEGLSLEVGSREVVALLGPSGCGKSTALEIVAGLQEPDLGTVSAAGAAHGEERLAACALMPQRDLLLPWRDAASNVALALEARGVRRSEARRRAEPLLGRFGLDGFASASPWELSGGMRRRVAFVRTLLAERPILLLDEPFAGLDSITRASLQEWLAGALRQEPRTTVLVTHDVEEALYLADRVAVLSPRPGRVVEEIEVDAPRGDRPRREVVTDPGFAALEERALEALEC